MPATTYTIKSFTGKGEVSLQIKLDSNCMKISSDWEKPEVSDYACEQRRLIPVDASTIRELTTFSRYRLESESSIKPQPPIHVKSPEHFDEIIRANPNKLIVIDFFATWCAPCKVMGPVFRHLALQTPTALFLKV